MKALRHIHNESRSGYIIGTAKLINPVTLPKMKEA